MSQNRREFIRGAALVGAGMLAGRIPVLAGDGPILVKKLDPAWVRSLYTRGAVTTYLQSRDELPFIGMPVGGINCGTVYLGGDGRLWLWDVFNDNQEGIEPKEIVWSPDGKTQQKVRSRDGACYVQPSRDIRPLEQGFAVMLEWEGRQAIRKLEAGAWAEIAFVATYPIATVRYTDPALPVDIVLRAHTPFIPLDAESSGLPATMMHVEVHNKTGAPVDVTLLGWLENKVGIRAEAVAHAGTATALERVNRAVRDDRFAAVWSGAEGLGQRPDAGTLGLAATGTRARANAKATIGMTLTAAHFTGEGERGEQRAHEARAALDTPLIGAVTDRRRLDAHGRAEMHFVIAWHFSNLVIKGVEEGHGRFYAEKFSDAGAVVEHIVERFDELHTTSRAWQETWYDSTLPWWFLERTLQNISTLATTTCHRFANGRFWAWEGVGSCPGNCTHVWHYAQAPARLFPSLERDTRARVDLGLAQQPDGGIWFRAEMDKRPAIDGQAGTILRFYREHRMTEDGAFLNAHWPGIKRAVAFLVAQDRNGDGMEDTPMENTLDAVWKGEIAWIVGLCIAAVDAGRRMAEETGDTEFAAACAAYVDKGRANMERQLFNGEYFIHRPDAVEGRKTLGSYDTCHIDQVLGQAWAFQAGLGRVLDRDKTLSALKALWKYNFTTDVGPYIATHTGGRPYALTGEGGLIMNTNPRNEPKPYGDDVTWQAGYFNECMTGFEHQVAAHMMAEGMTDEALVITRAIHDRYHAAKRNPFNEIECSDHYARAMASYGTFLTACGFEYHGPKGYLKFAPRLSPDHFKAPFTAAAGWGSYSQQRSANRFTATVQLRYGHLTLRELGVETGPALGAAKGPINGAAHGHVSGPVRASLRGKPVGCRTAGGSVLFDETLRIEAGETLTVVIG